MPSWNYRHLLFHNFIFWVSLESARKLDADPLGVLLVDATGPGQVALGQRADGHETTHDGPRLLLARVDRFAERLVAVLGRLDWVVAVARQHPLLEGADATQRLPGSPHIIGRDCLDAGLARLPDVRVRLPALARLDEYALRSILPHVAGSDGVLHLLGSEIFVRRRRA